MFCQQIQSHKYIFRLRIVRPLISSKRMQNRLQHLAFLQNGVVGNQNTGFEIPALKKPTHDTGRHRAAHAESDG